MGVCASSPKEAEGAAIGEGSPRMAPGIESSDDLLSVGSNPDFNAIRAIDSLPNIAEVRLRGTRRQRRQRAARSRCLFRARVLRRSSRRFNRSPRAASHAAPAFALTPAPAAQTNPAVATVFDVLTPTKSSSGIVGAGDAAAVGSIDNFALDGSARTHPSSRGKVRAAAKDGGGALSPVLEARAAPPATPGVFGADDADADMSPAQILVRRRSREGKAGATPVLGGGEKAQPSLPPRPTSASIPALPSRPGSEKGDAVPAERGATLKKSATAPTSSMGNALERLKRKAQAMSVPSVGSIIHDAVHGGSVEEVDESAQGGITEMVAVAIGLSVVHSCPATLESADARAMEAWATTFAPTKAQYADQHTLHLPRDASAPGGGGDGHDAALPSAAQLAALTEKAAAKAAQSESAGVGAGADADLKRRGSAMVMQRLWRKKNMRAQIESGKAFQLSEDSTGCVRVAVSPSLRWSARACRGVRRPRALVRRAPPRGSGSSRSRPRAPSLLPPSLPTDTKPSAYNTRPTSSERSAAVPSASTTSR